MGQENNHTILKINEINCLCFVINVHLFCFNFLTGVQITIVHKSLNTGVFNIERSYKLFHMVWKDHNPQRQLEIGNVQSKV